MDIIMEYINNNTSEFNFSMEYATLGDYFRAVHSDQVAWQVRDHHDFLPYSSGRSLGVEGQFGARGRSPKQGQEVSQAAQLCWWSPQGRWVAGSPTSPACLAWIAWGGDRG